MVKINDIDLLIAVIGLHGSETKGRTRIQKEICILKHKDKIPFGLEFKSYYYGPYSSELTSAMDTLVSTGLLEQTTTRLGVDVFRYDYVLTKQGKRLLDATEKKLKKTHPKWLSRISNRVRELDEMPIPQLVLLAKKCSGIDSKHL